MKWNWPIYGVMGVITLAAALQPYRAVVFDGESMAPTYAKGAVALTKPLEGPPKRGDVVVADGPDGPIVKRVALLPGDSYYRVYVFGEWVRAETQGYLDVAERRGLPIAKSVVPPGHIYLLGDNPYRSVDSRQFGPLPLTAVHRRVVNPEPLPFELRAMAHNPKPRHEMAQGAMEPGVVPASDS